MRHGSLFSGIGGFDLASEWMGWENVFHCEWNPFGQKVLNYYWPNSITYNDITKTDFTIHRGGIDIITGGFPCQPYSSAGKRLGKEDERHLWPEMLRAIREIQPTWVVGENVRGLTNWNGGLVFDEVQAELEAQGYEVTPFLLPACSVNAPHRRDRIWFIAYSDNKRRSSRLGEVQKENGEVSKWNNNAESSNSNNGTSTNPTASEAERGSERQLTVKDGKVQNISPKGVKYGMSIRQLAEQGFIPTPMASDATTGAIIGKNDIFVETKGLPRKINQNGTDGSVGLARLVQMLPTPNAYDWNTPRKPETFLKAKERHAQKGVNLQNPLKQMASMNMLPTPMASDCGEKVTGLETQDSLTKRARQITGQTSQLSPQFVMEMMGFPTDWTLLPFLNGDKSQLKQEETQ